MDLRFKVLIFLAFAVSFVSCDTVDCRGNTFRNNPRLLRGLSGWLYTVATSQYFADNEIFNCDVSYSKDSVFCRTTNDANCCRSFNISTTPINPGFREGGQYFPYEIETEDGCPTPLNESAHLKVLSEYRTFDQIYCLILYTCRPSRQGLHAFCSTPHINRVLRLMIDYEFRKYGQPQYNVKHNTDYRSGKCFPNGISREQDNIYQ